MVIVQTRYEHISLDEKNVPIITGTTTKVVELVLNQQAYGWSPEELHFQHPHLTLGQIYSALAYYWDHQKELDNDIIDRLEKAKIHKPQSQTNHLRTMLQKKGLIE